MINLLNSYQITIDNNRAKPIPVCVVKAIVTTTIGAIALAAPLDVWATSAVIPAWETPAEKLIRSLTGPIALVISLLALFLVGWRLVMGGDMDELSRRLLMIVFAVALVTGGASILVNLFNISAAVV